MILTHDQSQHFYSLWIPLLDFVNKRYQINENIYGMTSPQGLPLPVIHEIREALWENRELIDEYVQQNPLHLLPDDLSIISSWKSAVSDVFIVLRHLKSGSIFIPSTQNDTAYIVCGLFSSWEEMLQGAPLPTAVKTVLIPYGDKIIYDSLIVANRVLFGGNMKRSFNDHYRELKANGRVYKSLAK